MARARVVGADGREPEAIDVRLPRSFVEEVIAVLEVVDVNLVDEDAYSRVRGYFDNAQKIFKHRDEANRIEGALRRAGG